MLARKFEYLYMFLYKHFICTAKKMQLLIPYYLQLLNLLRAQAHQLTCVKEPVTHPRIVHTPCNAM